MEKSLLLSEPAGRAMLWDYLVRHKQQGAHSDAPELVFLGLCVAHFSMSSAQLLQDLYVLWRLRQKRGGYFVDFGATDGVSLSNTYLLERGFGWTGILSEPNPVWHDKLAKNRTATIDRRCVWRETGARIEFAATSAPEYSTIRQFSDQPQQRRYSAENIAVETVSLRDLLSAHGAPSVIDYLSIDTEGSELDILKAFDFSYRFRVITIEHNFNEVARGQIHQLLTARGYVRQFEDFSRFDDWYFDPGLMP